MNLAQLRQLAIAQVAGPSGAAMHVDQSAGVVDALINNAYHKIERSFITKYHEGTATLTVGTDGVVTGTPDDLATPLLVLHTSARHPYELHYHDLAQASFPQSRPRSREIQMYGIYEGELQVWPTPGQVSTLELKYFRFWADLVDDSDEPVFASAFHDLLATHAAAKLAARMPGKLNNAEALEIEWREGLQAMASSPLMQRSADHTQQEGFARLLWEGAGRDW